MAGLDLVGDGTAFRLGSYGYDLCIDFYTIERFPLPGPDHFNACLALTDWRMRFDCLRDGVTALPLETCFEGVPWRPPLPLGGC